MAQYNPNATNTAGLEWAAIRSLESEFGAGYTAGAAAIITATSTQTVDKMKQYLTLPGHFDSDASRTGLICDVYNADDFDGGPVLTAVSAPVADVGIPGQAGTGTLVNGQHGSTPILRSDNGTEVSRFQMVDEHPATFTVPAHPWNPSSDGLRATYPQTGDADQNPQIAWLAFKGATQFTDSVTQAGVSLVGKRILDVRIGAQYAGLAGGAAYSARIYGYLSDGTNTIELTNLNSPGSGMNVPNDSKVRQGTLSCFGAPFALSPQWKKADLDKFLLGGTGYFMLRLDGIRPGSQGIAVYNVWLEVTYANERRIATAHKRTSSSATPRWEQFDFVDPVTHNALTWTKTAGLRYMVVTRLGDWPGTDGGSSGTHSWRRLDIFPQNNAGAGGTLGGSFNVIQPNDPLPGQQATMVPFTKPETTGLVPGRAGFPSAPAGEDVATIDLLDVRDAARCYYFMAGATVRADSQPYAIVRPTLMNQNRVYQQELTSGITNGGYGVVRLLVLNDSKLHKADADLNVRVKVRSSGTQLGSAILARTELPSADNKWYFVTKRLATMSLTTGVQYLIELQTAASSPNGWTVQVLDAAGVEGAADSYGGTADATTLNGPEFSDRDMVATLSLIPAAPGNTSAVVAQYDTSRQLTAAATCPGGGCVVPAVDFAQLTWNESTLVGFARYEIDRLDDGTWRRIAAIADLKSTAFADFEVRRNVDAAWRIRQIRADGVDSDWAIIGILHVPADENEVVMASNDAPNNVLGLYDDPGFVWNRISSERTIEKVLYGRDNVIVFKEAERRGERFTRRFIMAFRSPIVRQQANWPLGGRAMFDPIVDLCEDPSLPHVTVCDWRGRRWYTSPTIASLTEEPNERYIAEVAFTEVAGPTPAIVSFFGGIQPPPPGEGGAYPGGYQEGY